MPSGGSTKSASNTAESDLFDGVSARPDGQWPSEAQTGLSPQPQSHLVFSLSLNQPVQRRAAPTRRPLLVPSHIAGGGAFTAF